MKHNWLVSVAAQAGYKNRPDLKDAVLERLETSGADDMKAANKAWDKQFQWGADQNGAALDDAYPVVDFNTVRDALEQLLIPLRYNLRGGIWEYYDEELDQWVQYYDEFENKTRERIYNQFQVRTKRQRQAHVRQSSQVH